MKKQLDSLIQVIKQDYVRHIVASSISESEIQNQFIDEFIQNIRVEEGRKYYKVLTKSAVWGFIVKDDNDKQFRKGDILLPASFKSPARNHARGNVLDEDFSSVRWTGPAYLF